MDQKEEKNENLEKDNSEINQNETEKNDAKNDRVRPEMSEMSVSH